MAAPTQAPEPRGADPRPPVVVTALEPAAPPTAGAPAADPSTLILNDPLVKRTVELFGAKVVHVEPWTR